MNPLTLIIFDRSHFYKLWELKDLKRKFVRGTPVSHHPFARRCEMQIKLRQLRGFVEILHCILKLIGRSCDLLLI